MLHLTSLDFTCLARLVFHSTHSTCLAWQVDNVAVELFKAPLTLTYSVMWVMSGGMREPGYMTRKALGMSAAEWADVDEEEQVPNWGLDRTQASRLTSRRGSIGRPLSILVCCLSPPTPGCLPGR